MRIEHENKFYRYDKTSDKLYTNESTILSTIASIVFIIVLFVGIYDFFKDKIRLFSGYKDIIKGEIGQGFAKTRGFTRANIIRNIIIYSLIFVSFLLMSSEKEVEVSPIPAEIRAKIL